MAVVVAAVVRGGGLLLGGAEENPKSFKRLDCEFTEINPLLIA
jgi:hypothetical protein